MSVRPARRSVQATTGPSPRPDAICKGFGAGEELAGVGERLARRRGGYPLT